MATDTKTLYLRSEKDDNGDYTLATSKGSSLAEEGFNQTVYLAVYSSNKTTALSGECSITITASSYTAYSCSTTFNSGVTIGSGSKIYLRLRDGSKTIWFSWTADKNYDVGGQSVSFTIYGYYDNFIGLAYVGFGDSSHASKMVMTYVLPEAINVVFSAKNKLRDAYGITGKFATHVVVSAKQRIRDSYETLHRVKTTVVVGAKQRLRDVYSRRVYRFWVFSAKQRLRDTYSFVHYIKQTVVYTAKNMLRDVYDIHMNTLVNVVFTAKNKLWDAYGILLYKARRCCRKRVRSS